MIDQCFVKQAKKVAVYYTQANVAQCSLLYSPMRVNLIHLYPFTGLNLRDSKLVKVYMLQ